jgi:glycosyltransferase involved in cell wall biosynthesis
VTCTESLLALIQGRSPYVYGKYERAGRASDRHNREWTPAEVGRVLTCAGFAVEQLTTASSWYPTRPAVVELLKQLKADTRLRDDNIMVVGRRAHAPTDRWPEEFYLSLGVQSDWREATRNAGGVSGNATAATAHAASQNLLVVHEYPPQFDASGADLRLLDLLETLRMRGDRVTYVGRFGARQPAHRHRLEQLGIEVISPDPERVRFLEELNAPLVDLPKLLAGRRFDAALLTHWYWCGVSVAEHYLDLVRRASPATKVIVLSDDVHWLREERRAARSGRRADVERARAMRVRDRDVYRRADLVLAITEDDRAKIAADADDTPVAIVRHVNEVPARIPDFRERTGLCFVGTGLNDANNTGIEWFLREVWPRVRAQAPQATFTIVGKAPPNGWTGGRALAGVSEVGQVPVLDPYLARASVFVAPLLFGTGLKTKNVHALAHGVPLVTTPIGAEGMGFDDPLAADVCDEPRAFADAVVRLLADETHWRRRSEAGLALARRRFARAGLRADLEGALQQLAAPRRSAPLATPVPVLAVETARPEILRAGRQPRLLERSNARISLADQHLAAGRVDDALLELRSILIEVQAAGDWWGFAPLYESLAVIYDDLGMADDAAASLVEARRVHGLRRSAAPAKVGVAEQATAGVPLPI